MTASLPSADGSSYGRTAVPVCGPADGNGPGRLDPLAVVLELCDLAHRPRVAQMLP